MISRGDAEITGALCIVPPPIAFWTEFLCCCLTLLLQPDLTIVTDFHCANPSLASLVLSRLCSTAHTSYVNISPTKRRLPPPASPSLRSSIRVTRADVLISVDSVSTGFLSEVFILPFQISLQAPSTDSRKAATATQRPQQDELAPAYPRGRVPSQHTRPAARSVATGQGLLCRHTADDRPPAQPVRFYCPVQSGKYREFPCVNMLFSPIDVSGQGPAYLNAYFLRQVFCPPLQAATSPSVDRMLHAPTLLLPRSLPPSSRRPVYIDTSIISIRAHCWVCLPLCLPLSLQVPMIASTSGRQAPVSPNCVPPVTTALQSLGRYSPRLT